MIELLVGALFVYVLYNELTKRDLVKEVEKNTEYIDLLVDDIAVLWERNKKDE